ncbi:MAG: galactose mutarotase [Bacteroidales bacterium]|jgi:aldose 1-epimerase|nr:galactose mutarotase [Bacteroidales bacterium]
MKNHHSIIMLVVAAVLATSCHTRHKAGIEQSNFGQFDGQTVELYTLTNHQGAMLKVITFGGIVTELQMPDRNGKQGNVVLGFDNLDGYLSPEYMRSNPYFGALIGRYGNRIAKGTFTLDSVTYTLATNDGENHLHGGNKGFNRVLWTVKPILGESENTLELNYLSADMEENYPGNLNVTVSYTLTDDNELKITYVATTDKATPCNLTNHSYFNLSAGEQPTIAQHELTIAADRYTEVDSGLIPTGNLPDVSGTPMDFTTPHQVGERINDDFEQLKFGGGYDHNWVLRGDASIPAATLYDPQSGRYMEVFTTEPGIQFYSGNFLDGTLTGKSNISYGQRAGLCLETQHFPDSPNQPEFPSTILRAGETYRTQTIYKFSTK